MNIILPSGDVVPFETDQNFYDQYMEAFSIGGKYQWQVVAQTKDGSEICISEVAKFDKSAYHQPNSGGNGSGSDDNNDGNTGNGGSEIPTMPPPEGGPEG